MVPASQIFKYLVIPVLTLEDDDVSNLLLVLNILMETLDSVEEPRHWILDEEPLQLLLMLLEMYQECNRFWEDWVADSRSDKSVYVTLLSCTLQSLLYFVSFPSGSLTYSSSLPSIRILTPVS